MRPGIRARRGRVRLAAVVVAAACAAILAMPLAAQGTFDPAGLTQWIESYRAVNRVPGVAVAVVRNGTVLFAGGFGHDSTGRVMTAASPVPIASLSKSFTSLAVMQLVEAGRVDLDAPVRTYLHDFQVADSRGAAITVRQALAHTSGLSDRTFHEKSGPLPHSLVEGVAMLRTATLESDPGTREHYHNPNYRIAARIVEVVSGQSFGDYLRAQVFAPLGMTTSVTVGRLEDAPRLPRGYVRVAGIDIVRPEPAWFLDGASGVVTTADDMARWLGMQTHDGIAPAGSRLISTAGLDAMHAGLGWNVRGEGEGRTIEHSGWLFTYTAHQILVPASGLGIAVVSNVGLGTGGADSDVIAHAIPSVLAGRPPSIGWPVGLIVDGVCLAMAAIVAAFAVRAVRRARVWAEAGARGRATVARGIAFWLIPLAVLATTPALLSVIFAGRDASLVQILYVVPAYLASLAVMTIAGLGVAAARVRALGAKRAASYR